MGFLFFFLFIRPRIKIRAINILLLQSKKILNNQRSVSISRSCRPTPQADSYTTTILFNFFPPQFVLSFYSVIRPPPAGDNDHPNYSPLTIHQQRFQTSATLNGLTSIFFQTPPVM